MLKNDGVLPLDSDADVLVTGPNADDLTAQVGGWSLLDPSDGTTLVEGIDAAGDGTVQYEPGAGRRDGAEDSAAGRDSAAAAAGDSAAAAAGDSAAAAAGDSAAAAAADADVAVVALGEGWYIHEFGPSELAETAPGAFPSRHHFGLPDDQRDLLRAIHGTGTPTVLVLSAGRPLPIPWAAEHLPAVLFTPPSGSEGGAALADVLFGAEPGGALPISMPRSAAHLPTHHDYVRHPHPIGDHEHPSSYDPLYPFGHGLSYGDVVVTGATVSETTVSPGERVTVSATVENRADRPGSRVVQAYLRDEYASRAQPVRELCGFERVDLDAGASTEVEMVVSPAAMGVVGPDGGRTIEPGGFTVTVGLSAVDPDATRAGFSVA
jgi:beta-glucosidase